VKFGGGDNGHNGLKSIRRALGTGDFYRVRVGVGRPPGSRTQPTFCSATSRPAHARPLQWRSIAAADAVESLVLVGLDKTQSAFNN
jgi:PTH1 family peptidyl-tRNA hydrolase